MGEQRQLRAAAGGVTSARTSPAWDLCSILGGPLGAVAEWETRHGAVQQKCGRCRPCNKGANSKCKTSGSWLTNSWAHKSKPFLFTPLPPNTHIPVWHFIQPPVAWDCIMIAQDTFITIFKSQPLALHKTFSFCSEKKTCF